MKIWNAVKTAWWSLLICIAVGGFVVFASVQMVKDFGVIGAIAFAIFAIPLSCIIATGGQT